VVVTNEAASTVSVLLANGDGSFQAPRSFPTGQNPHAVVVGDVNGDGKLDIVTANDDDTVSVLLGNGDGTFQAPRNTLVGGNLLAVALSDVNGDGWPDLVTSDFVSNTVTVLLSRGDGYFQSAGTYNVGAWPDAIAVADLTGAGHPDLIVANKNDDSVSVLLGNGDGTFRDTQTISGGGGPSSVTVADLNGDGVPDLVVADSADNSISVLLGNGDGAFQNAGRYVVGSRPGAVVAGYFNDDALPDLAVANTFDNSVSVLLGNGDGTFEDAQTYAVGAFPSALAVGDANGDGAYDLITANVLSNNVSVLLNQEVPQAHQLTLTVPDTLTAGTASTVTVRAWSIYGTVTSGYQSTVHFSSSDPRAGLPADYTFTAADRGIHTFNVTMCQAGAQTLTVTDAADASLMAGAAVSVVPGTVTSLALSVDPTTAQAGDAMELTVTAQDSCGNTVRGYRGLVHFTSSDGQATVPPDYTFTAGDQGVHTFPLILRTAANQTVRAIDVGSPSVNGTATVTVTPSAASTFILSGLPGSLMAGTQGSVTVTAKDQFGNTATGYSGTVHIASTDSGAALPADYAFTASDSGVHTFPVTLRSLGGQTIRVQDNGNPLIYGTINTTVTPAAEVFVFSGLPSGARAGDLVSVTVTVRDHSGNIAIDYRGTVHFASTDSAATLPSDYGFTAADRGVHTVSMILRTPGNRVVTATDTANGSISGGATISVIGPGDLDPTFGSGGTVTTTFEATEVRDVAIQSDGKTVAAGWSTDGAGRNYFALARYQIDGSLDQTFGYGGRIRGYSDIVYDLGASGVAVQPDGRIVVVGWGRWVGPGIALVRYTANGQPDTTFGNGGWVFTSLGTNTYFYSQVWHVVLQADGKIVVAGSVFLRNGTSWQENFALFRYRSDGSLDGSFGAGGEVVTNFGRFGASEAKGIVLQADGRIIVAGSVWFTNTSVFGLARYRTDGSLDPTFGNGGLVTTDWENNSASKEALAVAVQPDGRIVAVGHSGIDFALARYRIDGTLDPSFGTGGKAYIYWGASSQASGVSVQSNGKIVAAGFSGSTFALARFRTDGTLDPTFGNGGKVITAIGSGSKANAVALAADGRIIAAGWSDGRFALARYAGDPTGPGNGPSNSDGSDEHRLGSSPTNDSLSPGSALSPFDQFIASSDGASTNGTVCEPPDSLSRAIGSEPLVDELFADEHRKASGIGRGSCDGGGLVVSPRRIGSTANLDAQFQTTDSVFTADW
jgi:uncharacterized delta-60 repeat protein